MEYFDELDCRGEKTGRTIERDEAHHTGAWHGAFHCCILCRRNGRGYVLFQKRSDRKKIAPGKFDVSVGGHYSAGENAAIAGPREIREELGLEVEFTELVPLGRRVFVQCSTPGVIEYEFQDVFLLDRTVDPVDLHLQEEEVDGVILLELEQGVSMFATGEPLRDVSLYRAGRAVTTVSIAPPDFVPCLDNYYLKLLLIAQRYLSSGNGPFVI